jgi:hypothetical protein
MGEVQRYCDACGTAVDPSSARFCSGCGASLEGGSSTGSSETPEHEPTGAKSVKERATSSPSGAIAANRAIFVVLYLLLIVPTYVLPYVGSNSAVINSLGAAAGLGITPAFWIHAFFLVAVISLTWFRGAFSGRSWITIFPVLATFFDLTPGFSSIPLAPTVFHCLGIIFGVSSSSTSFSYTSSRPKIQVASLLALGAVLCALGAQLMFFDKRINPVGASQKQSGTQSSAQGTRPAVQRNSPAALSSSTQPLASSPSIQKAGHRMALDGWLRSHPHYRIASDAECGCNMAEVRKLYDNQRPFSVVADLSRDGVDDFATVVVDTRVNLSAPYPSNFGATLLVFSGPVTADSQPALVAPNIGTPAGAQLFYSRKERNLRVGKWESSAQLLVHKGGRYALTF